MHRSGLSGVRKHKRRAERSYFSKPNKSQTGGDCQGKLAFESPNDAYKAMRNRKAFGKTSQAYRCSVCHKWHIAGRTR